MRWAKYIDWKYFDIVINTIASSLLSLASSSERFHLKLPVGIYSDGEFQNYSARRHCHSLSTVGFFSSCHKGVANLTGAKCTTFTFYELSLLKFSVHFVIVKV